MWKMTQREYQEMLQIGTLDVENNTLFAKNPKVAIDKNHLTLVISSGGCGASVIKKAIRTAEQKLEPDYARYMKFVLVDSACGEIEHTKNRIRSNNLHIFNISVDGSSKRMEYINRPDFFRTWVPKTYDPTGSWGGRDRLTAKTRFYDGTKDGYNDVKFRQLIHRFYNEDWATFKSLPVDIMIITGISGGTGSGTFLDLAAHARKACMDAGVTEDIRVFGYLFLPDVVENFESNNPDTQNRLYANGYAALKELESYMDIPFNPERKEIFRSRDGVTNMVIDSNRPLFNYTTLISGDYDETTSMMSEFIINMALKNNDGFDQRALYGHIPLVRECYLSSPARLHDGLLEKDFFPEDSHRYAGIGYAYAGIPEKIIKANIIGNVCRKMYELDPMKPYGATCFCTIEKKLPRSEMESIVRHLFSLNPNSKVTERSFWDEKIMGKLDQVSTLSPNLREITRDEIRSGRTETYKQGFNAVEKEAAGKAAMKEYLRQIWTSFVNNAAVVMGTYGPRVMEFIYTGKGPDDKDGNPQYFPDISIRRMLEYAKYQLQTIVEDERRGVEPSNNIPLGLAGVVFRRNEWKLNFHMAVQYQTKQAIAKDLIEMRGPWEEIISSPIREYMKKCTVFAERLETLADFYKREGYVLEDASYVHFVKQSQQGNCVSLFNDANVFQWVKNKVQKKIDSISIGMVKADLIYDFIHNQRSWLSMEEGVTRKAFDAVMANSCGLGIGSVGVNDLSLTVTDYFNDVLSQVEPAQVSDTVQRLVENIVCDLLQKSKPSIRKVRTPEVINRFMMLPQGIQESHYGNEIIAAFRNAWNNHGAGYSNISLSPSVSDIICYQISVANGMCDLSDLDRWERAYNNSTSALVHLSNGEYNTSYIERTKTQIDKEETAKNGVPLVLENLTPEEDVMFGTGLSWRHYPSLDLRKVAENVEEQRFMDEIFNPVVDFALEEGIIERQEVGPNTYRYVMHVIPENWRNLDVSVYDKRNEEGEYVLGDGLFKYLRNLNPLGDQEYTKEIRLSGSGYFDQPFDFTEARTAGNGMTAEVIEGISLHYMKRILRRNTALFLELRKTLNRYYPVYQMMKQKMKV